MDMQIYIKLSIVIFNNIFLLIKQNGVPIAVFT